MNKFLNPRTILTLCFIGLVVMLALIYTMFKPEQPKKAHPNQNLTTSLDKNTTNGFQSVNHDMPIFAKSLNGTEIDCPIQVDKNGNLILTVGIKSCFDYFFSSLGEKTESQLILDMQKYFTSTLPDTAAKYAIYLLKQYVAYTHALQNLKPDPNLRKGDIDGFQKIVDQMLKLQQQYFKAEEIKALFGNEHYFNQFNIDQMRIYANKSLSTEQKATEIAKLIDHLPPTLADGVRVSMQFSELQQLTQEIKAKGGSEQELRAMRENLLGRDAADRLEKVDQEESAWQTEVNRYLSAREQILKSNSNEADKEAEIKALRDHSFNSEQDILRAQSYEIIHDQQKH